jgi:hypothetical protein
MSLKEANGKTKQENTKLAAEALLSLKDKIDLIKKLEVGINDKKASKDNFDIVLIEEFESFNDLEAYLIHPEHIKTAEFIQTIRVSRAVVDYVI